MALDADKAIHRTLRISGLVATLLLSTALTAPAFAAGGDSWSDASHVAPGGDDSLEFNESHAGGDGNIYGSGGGGGGAGIAGGQGGAGHDGVTPGGAGGGGGYPRDGGDGSTDTLGFGTGGGGGAHGYFDYFQTPVPEYSTTGGNGGAGGAATTVGATGGGGGAGGYGAAVRLTVANVYGGRVVPSHAVYTGGDGGDGGDGLNGARGGNGGSGGAGLGIYNPLPDTWFSLNYTIRGTVTGGNGGDGGANGGAGGNGGAGIAVSYLPNTMWLDIDGAVTGGNGGAAGSNGGLAGLGGVGVEGSSLFILVRDGGSITGGMSGDSLSRANAVNFTGGGNTLVFFGATSQLSGNINVAQDASVLFASMLDDGTEVDNVITGGGSVLTDSTITLTGTNTYSGGTTVFNDGILTLSGAGTLGDASGSTNVRMGGILDLGGTTQTQATVRLGDFGGEGTIRNGNLNAAIWSAGGTIENVGGTASLTTTDGTTTLLGTNSYSGATVVDGGRLKVQGAITGTSSVDVNDGGILGGNGVIDAPVVRINDGGIVGPGNSIGTLTINGDLEQKKGSTYEVELTSAGLTDRMNVSGTATIEKGALLNVVKLDTAPYVLGTSYLVLQANDGVSGKYTLTGDTALSAFIGLVGRYEPTQVYLDVTRTKSFAAAGLTRNQRAAGAGAESLGSGNPLYESILMAPTDAIAQYAFDQISGEIHASAKSVMIEDSRFARDAAMDRLRDAFDAVGAVRSPVTTYVDGKPALAAASTEGFAFWSRGFGSWGQWDSDGNAATIKRDISGFFAGGDGIVADTWRVGVLGGFSRSTFNVEDRFSAGSSDNLHVGLYGGTQWGDVAFRSGAAYTWHRISTDRSVTADYNARTAQAFGELGYGIQAGSVAFEPFANLAYVNLATDGFSERGTGGEMVLTGASSSTNATFTTLGARAATSFSLGATTATAKGTLGWRHAYGDVTPLSQMRFAGGDAFTIAGVPIARDVATVEAGLDFALSPTAVLGVSYGGQFGSGLSDQSVKANFNVKF
ncbi:autotransporter outer membrane beta-barrel domain-containing protein [Pseudaminobacter soli (ex Li et al. 2025)]|uniref:Autotransporter outer membrane beta-barrel domain-containing protein n=1 Tax=Pseudaminobacter soli (ex Li et al. 2025) TaxID=1295366 RepID=A0A2P7SMF2_9HYPH|nr:autotransporter domain-containing protein [Mesorhizobium soli]PSJ63565.1 autotransporter outer membrane beta-barrel domain-containing protein [Mesorhizobium soli]